ncbi:MAG: DUF1704 domain-containing protein [Crocinitomicaceae bacterium]|nr:DUF1704 domain-containing protein [Crocinitomicaceae bacterium]
MKKEAERIIAIADALDNAAGKINILRNIAWSNEIEKEFFRNKAQKLPQVEYAPYNSKPVIDELKKARALFGGNDIIDNWADRIANKLESSALLLENRGTNEFFTHSKNMYGCPKDILPDGQSTALDLAKHFGELFEHVRNFDLGAPPQACVLPTTLADEMQKAVQTMFGNEGPKIVMDDSISSNAIAGRRRIAINPEACFTDKDIQQLIEHEVYIHVATSINGHHQDKIKILGAGHCGTTETQEGLAVFSEFITGCIDLERTRRLSDRVLATQMVIDGADFIELYRNYLDKTDDKQKAFDSAKRVFRGGNIQGGAPFTKDIVYLEGLVRVQNFLSVVVGAGKFEYIDLLFCGKLDLSDIPALKLMDEMGLIVKPKFLPPWIRDKRFLLTHLTYSSFLSGTDSSVLHRHYKKLFEK